MSTRFRPLTPENERSKDDEILIDLERFEAELAESIARLGGNPPTDAPLPPRDVGANEPMSRFPPLAQPATAPQRPAAAVPPAPSATARPAVAPQAPAAPAPAQSATAASSSLDLLSELRLAVKEKVSENNVVEADKKARIARTDHAMRMLFRYLGEFSGHLDEIQPALSQTFRPLPNIELSALRWSESFIDYRTNGGTEISPLDSISLRYKLSAGDRVLVSKLPNHAPAYVDELKRVGLSYTTSEKRGVKGLTEQIDFAVERALTVTLLFKAHPEREVIELRARNFTGLGHTHYTVNAADIDQSLLDELGKHILGRPNQLFQRLIKEDVAP